MHDALISAAEVDDFIIVRATSFTSKIQRAMVRDVLRAEDLPVLEWRLLFSVARFGSCHLAYITRRTSIDPAHGSRAVAALENKGLIMRTDDPQNKRRRLISLTDQGKVVFDRVWPLARQKMAQVTQALSRDELNALKALLDKANAAAEPLLGGKERIDVEQEIHIAAMQ